MALSGYTVLCGQPVGVNTPSCVNTGMGSVGKIEFVDIHRTLHHKEGQLSTGFLDGRHV
jgi:hypothetical protein